MLQTNVSGHKSMISRSHALPNLVVMIKTDEFYILYMEKMGLGLLGGKKNLSLQNHLTINVIYLFERGQITARLMEIIMSNI